MVLAPYKTLLIINSLNLVFPFSALGATQGGSDAVCAVFSPRCFPDIKSALDSIICWAKLEMSKPPAKAFSAPKPANTKPPLSSSPKDLTKNSSRMLRKKQVLAFFLFVSNLSNHFDSPA